jgi:hypothetical protein
MPRADFAGARTPAQRLVLKLLTGVRLAELDPLVQAEADGTRREALHRALGAVSGGIAALSDALTAQYFRHEEQPHSLLHRGEGAGP